MKIHTITDGESLEDIAGQYGYGTWLDIYSHPANAELREKKPNPGGIEPGDQLKVPTPPSAAANKVATGGAIKLVVSTVHRGQLFWNRTWDYDTSQAIAPVKEYLPGAKVELHIQKKGASALALHESAFLSDTGEFAFKDVPECTKLELKLFLEHRARITLIKGLSNAFTQADFEVKTGQTVWHQLPLDPSKAKNTGNVIDFGDVEITKAEFVELCDAYKTICLGHQSIKLMAGHKLNFCPVNYPQPTTGTSHHRGGQLYLLKDDLKDRSVILHEYGHYIGHELLGGLNNPGYGYNDDAKNQHSKASKEHYEAAWNEAHATFLACAIRASPVYRDGYDANLTYDLSKDNTQVGPHSEGSIQEALWRVHAVHKVDFQKGFWTAFTTRTKRTARTAYDLYENWKDLKCPDLDKLKEAYTQFNMKYFYRYERRFSLVKAPLTFDLAAKRFTTIDELYDAFGKTGGGTLADYKEEFYNRNKQFNSSSLDAGASPTDPKLLDGMSYIVPERFELS